MMNDLVFEFWPQDTIEIILACFIIYFLSFVYAMILWKALRLQFYFIRKILYIPWVFQNIFKILIL
jgi:hypothetical protein